MSIELIVFIVAALIVLVGAGLGWRQGGAITIRYALVTLFATLVAVHYWQAAAGIASRMTAANPGFVAAIVFVIIFSLSALVCGLVIRLGAQLYHSVAPNPLEKVLGVLFGGFAGALVGGVILMLAILLELGTGNPFNPGSIPVRIDLWPGQVVHRVEIVVTGSPSSLPSWKTASGPADGSESPATIVWD